MSEEDRPVESNPASGGENAAPAVAENEEIALAAGVAAVNLVDEEDDDDDSEVNPMSTLPPYVVKRVDKLLELNTQRDEIMDQYLADRAALEAKYHALCEPLYAQRANIVKGFCDDEIAKEANNKDADKEKDEEKEGTDKDDNKNDGEENKDDKDENKEEKKVVGIPQFWVCAMSHMEPLAELITEEDVECLEQLTNVTCLDDPEGTGFTLEFHFSPNDYFTNSVLTKRYQVPNLLLEDEPILKNVEGCKIQWKRSLTYREVTKKQRGTGKNSGMVRTVKKKERLESFFHFFDPPKMPSMDDMDEEEADRLEEAFEEDYDVAQAFRSHIIPKAVLWFTGQAMEDEMSQMFNIDGGQEGVISSHPFPQAAPGDQPPECQQT